MNIRRHLTMDPRSDAARRLRQLSLQLPKLLTPEDAIAWRLKLETWWQAYGHLTKVPSSGRQTSWLTHGRLREAWQLLSRLCCEGELFTYVRHANARTTSPQIGGMNSGVRTVLRNHRGIAQPQMKPAAEWFLTLHKIPITRAYEMVIAAPAAPDASIDLP